MKRRAALHLHFVPQLQTISRNNHILAAVQQQFPAIDLISFGFGIPGDYMKIRIAAALAGATVSLCLFTSAQAQTGIASVYAYKGEKTANGEFASPHSLTAAHKTLPLGTRVRVTNKKNGKTVVVRINDRGPYVAGRIIDLTPAGARALGMDGLAPVEVKPL